MMPVLVVHLFAMEVVELLRLLLNVLIKYSTSFAVVLFIMHDRFLRLTMC